MSDSTPYNEQQEMEQIIGAMPSRIWQRGLLWVLFLLMIFLLLAYFVRYPDVVEVPVYLTSEEPVVEVINPFAAVLDTVLVKEGQRVEKDDILAYFRSQERRESILQLEMFLKRLDTLQHPGGIVSLNFPDLDDIGSLKGESGALEMAMEQLADQYLSMNIDRQIQSLRTERQLVENLSFSIQQQIDKIQEEVSLAEKNYRDFEALFQSGAASEIEKDAAKTSWLGLQRMQESKKAEILQNQVNLNRVSAQINALQQTQQLQLKDYVNQVHQKRSVLAGLVEEWKATYLLRTPVKGEVVFPTRRFSGQFIQAETRVFGISDSRKDLEVLAFGQLSGTGVGKVKKDLEVFIRLQSFPYKQFGELEGRVGHIADLPIRETGHVFYEVEIRLPNQLQTNFEKQLSFREGLPGTARIITEDRSLLGRFLEVFNF